MPGLVEAKDFQSAQLVVLPLSSILEYLRFLLDLRVVSCLGGDESWMVSDVE